MTQHIEITPEVETFMSQVILEYKGCTIESVTTLSETLLVLMDLLVGAKGTCFLIMPKSRRQGKRGKRSARNYLARKSLWFAREYMGYTRLELAKDQVERQRQKLIPFAFRLYPN